ncbi:uncharacterized protein HaLaN_22159, partial [Haematococcus lacustris]
GAGGGTTQQGPGAALPGTDKVKWWQQRYQALFTPSIGYSDGSNGLLQLDTSMDPEVLNLVALPGCSRDVRVVMFEDHHDCMHCITIMRQWPEFEWHNLQLRTMPTRTIEAELVQAWRTQVAEGAKASRPAGVVVFRRGKLPMRVGMGMEEFTRVVILQASAQLSLSKVGYNFDDF